MINLEQRIYDLTKELQLINFATTDNGRPRVRYVVGHADASLTLRFSTYIDSNKVRQIKDNPNVFLTLGGNSIRAQTWLQVEGVAEVTTAVVERRSFWFDALERYFQDVDDPRYSIIIVKPTTIQLCSMDTPPEVWHQH